MDCWERLRERLLKDGRVTLRVKPGARKLTITCEDEMIISLPAQPYEGEANRELVRILKKKTRLSVAIRKGQTSRVKEIILIGRKD